MYFLRLMYLVLHNQQNIQCILKNITLIIIPINKKGKKISKFCYIKQVIDTQLTKKCPTQHFGVLFLSLRN